MLHIVRCDGCNAEMQVPTKELNDHGTAECYDCVINRSWGG